MFIVKKKSQTFKGVKHHEGKATNSIDNRIELVKISDIIITRHKI